MKMDIQVKLCLQEIVKLDLEVQALIQVCLYIYVLLFLHMCLFEIKNKWLTVKMLSTLQLINLLALFE